MFPNDILISSEIDVLTQSSLEGNTQYSFIWQPMGADTETQDPTLGRAREIPQKRHRKYCRSQSCLGHHETIFP